MYTKSLLALLAMAANASAQTQVTTTSVTTTTSSPIVFTDMTIRTAILETRFLTGDQPLYDELVTRFDKDVVQGTASEFVTAKLAEREERHRRGGQAGDRRLHHGKEDGGRTA